MGRGRVHRREVTLALVRHVASGDHRLAQVPREHGIAERLPRRRRPAYGLQEEGVSTLHQPS
jgi:hypothetical protein